MRTRSSAGDAKRSWNEETIAITTDPTISASSPPFPIGEE